MEEGKLIRCHRCGKKIFLHMKMINQEVDSHYNVARTGYASLPRDWSTVTATFHKYDEDGDWSCSNLHYCPECTSELKEFLCIFGGYKGEYRGKDPLEEVLE